MKPISVLLLLGLLTTLSNVQADGPDGFLVKQSRNTDYTLNRDRVDITVKFVNSTIKYRSRFCLKTSGIPNLQGEFLNNASVTPGNGLGFRISLLGLAEINEGKGWNLTTSGNTVRFPGSNNMWSDISVTNMTGDNSVIVQRFLTSFTNTSAPKFNVTIDAYLTPNETTLMGLSLKPYSFKYGIVINNFPYVYNDSRLAIVKAVFYKSSDKGPDFSAPNRSLAVAPGCRFNWTSTLKYTNTTGTIDDAITTDNTTSSNLTSVGAKIDSDPDRNGSEGMAIIVFKTQPGNFSTLAWDPELALNDDAIVSSSSSSSGSSTTSDAIMTTASFGLSFIVLLMTVFVNVF